MSSSKHPGRSIKYLLSRNEINNQYPHLYDAILTTSTGDSIPFYQLFIQNNAPELQVLKKEKNGIITYKTTYDTDITIKALEYILTGKIDKEFPQYKKVEEFLKTSGTSTSKWIKYSMPTIYEKMPLADLALKSKYLKQPIQMHRLVLACHCTKFRNVLSQVSNKPTPPQSSTPYIAPENFAKYMRERKDNMLSNPMEIDLDQFQPSSEKHIRAIIQYCYTEDFESSCEKQGISSDEDLTELFNLAERMGLIGIVGEYAKKMSTSITLKNVGRIFSLATRGEEQDIHDKAVHFIFTNWGILRKGELDGQMSSDEERHLFEKVSGIADMFCLHKKNGMM